MDMPPLTRREPEELRLLPPDLGAESAEPPFPKEVTSGLYVCGMCANAVFGGPRMGPIFGGMLLSGKKVAEDLLKRLR